MKSSQGPSDLNENASPFHPFPINFIPFVTQNAGVSVTQPDDWPAPLDDPSVVVELAHADVPLRPKPVFVRREASEAVLPIIKNSIFCLFHALECNLTTPL